MTTATALRIAREALSAKRDLDSLSRALMVADESNLDTLRVQQTEAAERYRRLSAEAMKAHMALANG